MLISGFNVTSFKIMLSLNFLIYKSIYTIFECWYSMFMNETMNIAPLFMNINIFLISST